MQGCGDEFDRYYTPDQQHLPRITGDIMPDIDKVIKAIDICVYGSDCETDAKEVCPYAGTSDKDYSCAWQVLKDAGILLKEYHKADGFLAVHGWNGWSLQKPE